jgi:hypothetical protein
MRFASSVRGVRSSQLSRARNIRAARDPHFFERAFEAFAAPREVCVTLGTALAYAVGQAIQAEPPNYDGASTNGDTGAKPALQLHKTFILIHCGFANHRKPARASRTSATTTKMTRQAVTK